MRNKTATINAIFIGILATIFVTFLILVNTIVPPSFRFAVLITGNITFFLLLVMLLFGLWLLKKNGTSIRKSFNYYLEHAVSSAGVGVIVFNSDLDIIWVSKFIIDRSGRNVVGRKINNISEDFAKNYLSGKKVFNFNLEGITYHTTISFEHNLIVLRDVTASETILRQYFDEKLVVGELEIDNFQQLQTLLAEEELFEIQSTVIKMLDKLVSKYNIVYRQYVNGKFIILTNQSVLDRLIQRKFTFLDAIRQMNILDGIQLSSSIGFGAGTSLNKELVTLSKKALLQTHARGGDQVCIMYPNHRPLYFGSKTRIANVLSKVKIKQTTNLLENRLESKKIKRVIIYGHKTADLDAVGASIGLYEIAKSYGKEAYIQNVTFDKTTARALKELVSKDYRSAFIKPSKANRLTNEKETIIIVVDTADRNRIENSRAFDNVDPSNVFVFDHHRAQKLPEFVLGINTYIDTARSSACEIVVEIFGFLKQKMTPTRQSAQMMLNGIYLDTMHFQQSTSARTFEAAGWLESFGATSKVATDLLKLSDSASKLLARIFESLEEIKPGYYLATFEGEVPQDVLSIASDEILRTQGRKASFVIGKIPGQNTYKLSARSVDVNVQVIAEEVGGGGNFTSAAATSTEEFNVFVDNLKQAIVSKKEDQSESDTYKKM